MYRKIFLFICLIIGVCSPGVRAQVTFAGISAGYGTWIRELGISAYGIYSVNQKIDIVPNLTYFLPHVVDIEPPSSGTIQYDWVAVNLDGHYIFFEKSVFQVFGLMGLNFINETKRIDEVYMGQPFQDKTNTTKIGLNVGAGVQFHLSKFFVPFTEIKYTLGEKDQGVVSLGVLFRISPDRFNDDME